MEAYSYEMRNNLDSYGTFEKYLNETAKAAFMKDINFVVEWIYGDGENAAAKEYREWMSKFKAIGDPVKQRHFYYSELEVYYAQWATIREKINTRYECIDHLTELQKEIVASKAKVAQDLIDGVKADRAAKELHEDPKYTLEEIIAAIAQAKKDTDAIL